MLFFNRDYLHEDKIPDWLGGLAQIPIPEGGLVPKSYYMSSQVSDMTWLNFCLFFTFLWPRSNVSQEFEKDQSPGPHLIENYHSLSLNKGQVGRNLVWCLFLSGRDDEKSSYLTKVAPTVGDQHLFISWKAAAYVWFFQREENTWYWFQEPSKPIE